jgi:hypothetical protein
METEAIVALALTLASACALNWGYLTEHGAASKLPPLRFRRPLRSLRLLLGSRDWLIGFLWETAGFVLYVGLSRWPRSRWFRRLRPAASACSRCSSRA